MTEARASLVPGAQITKAVALLEPLSSGGMGSVWLADHLGLKTRVVVKFMLLGLDANDSARSRFSREAAAAAQVKSPHVVQMLDHGVSDDGVPFIVMEHLEGHDLGDEIEQHGALDPAKVIAIVIQVAKALSKVHAAGLLHRDIKPDNIFLCAGEEDVFVKLLDFGVAKSSSLEHGDLSLDGETKTGQIVGTPYYMSPEQVTAQKNIDHRSDLWALGVVAYEALTGQRPYDGPSFGALAVKIATGSPPKPSEVNPALPSTVDLWFEKACARDPAERFSSAKEMADAFRAAFEGIVSIPSHTMVPSSDLTARAVASSSSKTRVPPKQGPEHESSDEKLATIGLAATAIDDSASSNRHATIGRSETGLSLLEVSSPASRSSSLLFIGGAIALTLAVAGVLMWSAQTPSHAVGVAASTRATKPAVTAFKTTSSPKSTKDGNVSAAAATDASSDDVSAVPTATATGSTDAAEPALAGGNAENQGAIDLAVDAGAPSSVTSPPRSTSTRPVKSNVPVAPSLPTTNAAPTAAAPSSTSAPQPSVTSEPDLF